MLRVAQNKDEIIIRELPVLKWINAALAAVAVFFIALITISVFTGIRDLFRLLFLIAPLVGFVLYLLNYPTITTKINTRGRTVSIKKQSLLSYSFDVYSFNEIEQPIYVDVRNDDYGAKGYQLKMALKNGRKVDLSRTSGSRQSQYFDAAHLMNPYIFGAAKQIPSRVTVFND